MVFDINIFKEEIRDTLRVYLNPNNTISDTEVQLSDGTIVNSIAESFYPFSKCYSTVSPYSYTIPVSIKIKKTGTPDGNIFVSLQSNNSDNPSGTTIGYCTIPANSVSTTFSVLSGNIKTTSMLGSNTKYWIAIEPQCSASTVNFYSIEKSTLDTYIIGNSKKYIGNGQWTIETGDIYFNITTPQWIYQDYPRENLSKHSFPRLAIDMISRRSQQKLINVEIMDYYIDFTIIAYSYYPDELDRILSYADRAIFIERVNFDGLRRIDSGELSPVTTLRDNLFTRALTYQIMYRMTAQ